MGTTDGQQAVEFALSVDDIVACNGFVFMRHLKRWRFPLIRRIVLIVVVPLLTTTACVRWQMGELPARWSDFAVDNSSIIVGLLVLLLFPYAPLWIARWRFRGAAYAKLRAPRRIEISPAGLRSIDGISDSRTPWSSIIEIAVTPDAAYLFIFKGSAHVVPRSAFADAAAFDAFVAAATNYWRPRVTAAAAR
jgi:hypothetical protein